MNNLQSPANLPEVFANWQVAPSYPSVEVAFDLGRGTDGEASLWQIDLPSDPIAADAQLERSAAQVSATQTALENIPGRIDTLVIQRQVLGSHPVAFDMAAFPTLAEPESELLRWLDSVDPGQQVSFGMESVTSSEVKGAGAQFLQGTDQLLRLLVHFAWVETQVEGDLLARTVVDWTGDSNTAWGGEFTPEQFQLHQRSLRLALASRTTLLRIFIIVTQSAAKISALVATPGGALLALPAAWKFVNKVLAEVKNYQEISNPPKE
jgi:hypothetical protein